MEAVHSQTDLTADVRLVLSTEAGKCFRNISDIFSLYPALVDRMSDNVKLQVVSPSAFTPAHCFPFG